MGRAGPSIRQMVVSAGPGVTARLPRNPPGPPGGRDSDHSYRSRSFSVDLDAVKFKLPFAPDSGSEPLAGPDSDHLKH